ncbi:MAG: hypothetical protein WKF71_13815 [Pyrinomonadaceae bacterium]
MLVVGTGGNGTPVGQIVPGTGIVGTGGNGIPVGETGFVQGVLVTRFVLVTAGSCTFVAASGDSGNSPTIGANLNFQVGSTVTVTELGTLTDQSNPINIGWRHRSGSSSANHKFERNY